MKVGSLLCGHEQYANNLTYTCQPARVNLAYINSFGLEQLLEHHAIVCVFTSGNANSMGLECLADGSMPKDVVRSSGFLDEPVKENSETLVIVGPESGKRADQGLTSSKPLT
jgi:hypothetical protein